MLKFVVGSDKAAFWIPAMRSGNNSPNNYMGEGHDDSSQTYAYAPEVGFRYAT